QQRYTRRDYQLTAAFSQLSGDNVTIPFNGTGIRWVTSKDPSHGIADVYLDGTKVGSTDLYAAAKENQVAGHETPGRAPGAHTLKIVATGQTPAPALSRIILGGAGDL